MNQELEEKTVRKLFHEMKREDAGRAPSFASVEAAARARLSDTRRPMRVVRVAVAASLLIALTGAAIIFYRQVTGQRPATELSSSQPVTPEPFVLKQIDPPTTLSQSLKAERLKVERVKVERVKAVRLNTTRQRARTRVRQSSLEISRWRSPTDFLLKGSGEQLLKSVPRLNDSIIEIKSIIPIERN